MTDAMQAYDSALEVAPESLAAMQRAAVLVCGPGGRIRGCTGGSKPSPYAPRTKVGASGRSGRASATAD